MARANKTVVYGIPNCDTVKKARVWLEEHGVEFEFHDFKKAGVDRAARAGLAERRMYRSTRC
jgi:arsenate reductase